MSATGLYQSARADPEIVASMLTALQDGKTTLSIAPGVDRPPSVDQSLTCVFDFEPRLRYLRYITEFNRVLNSYTAFEFDVYSIRRGCLDVCFFAREFDVGKKNTVRRQIISLMRDYDIANRFHITRYTLFGRFYNGVPHAPAG